MTAIDKQAGNWEVTEWEGKMRTSLTSAIRYLARQPVEGYWRGFVAQGTIA